VLVVTEQVGTGDSVARLKDAFTAHGVDASHIEMPISFAGLNGIGGSSQRQSVGVERHTPEPVSRRHPSYDSEGARGLRSFIDDYTKVLYTKIFGTNPPSDKLPAARYVTQWRTKLEPKEKPKGKAYSRKRFGLPDAGI
jgi:hypothetical protein